MRVDHQRVDLDPVDLFAALVVSTVGLALWRYGRKEQRLPQGLGGLALMIGPYLVADACLTLLFAAGVLVAVVVATRLDF